METTGKQRKCISRDRNSADKIEPPFREKVTTVLHLIGYTLLFSHLSFIPYAYAGPTGGTIVGGVGDIQQSGLTTTINQNSSSLAINWNTFNVNKNEIVNYIQPNSSSIALNRILGNNGSQIQGQINANGQVILVNPNGIFFSETSSINVGGLIASGLDIDPVDFMNGNYVFNALDGTSGTVVNSGILNAATGGSITLLGKQVNNTGLISANLGAVNMAAGNQAVVTFDSTGLVGIRITKAILQEELGIDSALVNNGVITAQGGRILLTASQSQDLFSQAVNTGDITQATSVVVNEDGTFTLGSGADVVNNGTLDVSQQDAGQDAGQVVMLGENVTSSGNILADALQGNGGDIELHAADTTLLTGSNVTSARSENDGDGGIIKILGNKVGLFDSSVVDVSGANNGGKILIGGDQQGLNPNIRNAEFIYLGENTEARADGLTNGNGGMIIAFAEDTARIYGDLFAQGGTESGDGGFVETSGLKGFDIIKSPEVGAVNGAAGEWLIDPDDITIVTGGSASNITTTDPFTTTGSVASLGVNLIKDAMTDGANVTITTGNTGGASNGGTITFDTDLDYNGTGTNTLTLNAAADIDLGGHIIWDSDFASDSLNLLLNAGSGGYSGNVTLDGSINTGQAGDFSVNASGLVTAVAGSTLTVAGTTSLTSTSGDIVLNQGTNDFTGAVSVTANNARLKDSNDIELGASSVSGNLDVSANGTITQSGALAVTGYSSFISSKSNAAITLDDQYNDLQGVVTLTAASGGTYGGSVTLYNTSNITYLGDVTARGGLSITAEHDLYLTGTISDDYDIGGSGNYQNVDLTFGKAGTDSLSTFTMSASAELNATDGSNDYLSITITGGTVSNKFEFSSNSAVSAEKGDITISGVDAGSNEFDLYGSMTSSSGSIAINGGSGVDTFYIGATIDGTIYGAAGDDRFNIINSNMAVTSLQGDAGSDTLTGFDDVNDWQLTGSNSGSLTNNNKAINYTNIENLTGGTNSDTFTLAGGTIDGALTGGGGTDTLTGADTDTNWGITASGAGYVTDSTGASSYIGGGFTGIGTLQGGSGIDVFTVSGTDVTETIDGGTVGGSADADILVSCDCSTNIWTLTNLNEGNLTNGTGTIDFLEIENLSGNTNTDTLIGPNQKTTWTIQGTNSGTMSFLDGGFSGMENLYGGTEKDTFQFNSGSDVQITGLIDAGTGDGVVDTVDYSNLGPIDVYIANAYKGVVNAEEITATDSTLYGNDVNSTWTLSDANFGTYSDGVNSIQFDGFINLNGGSSVDNFVYESNGSTSGLIDGGAGVDTVDMSGLSSVSITLGTDVDNVENVIGQGSNSTLIGKDAVNTWTISSSIGGGYTNDLGDDVTFSGINNLTGGTQNDTFVMNAQFDGVIADASTTDNDLIDYSSLATVSVDLSQANIQDIENIKGNNSTSTLIGTNSGDTWSITDNNDGMIGGISFTDFNILQGGSGDDTFDITSGGSVGDQTSPDTDNVSGIFGGDGNDTLNVTLTGAETGTIKFDGQGAGGDTDTVNINSGLVVYDSDVYRSNPTGNNYDRLTYILNGNSYTVNYDYSNTETINDDVLATDLTIYSEPNTTLSIGGNGAGNNTFQITNHQQVGFTGKTNVTASALSGQANPINLGDVKVDGALALYTDAITQSANTIISADSLSLNDASSVDPLSTDINSLSVDWVTSNLDITEVDGVSVDALDNFTGGLTLTATAGDITQGTSSPLGVGGDINLTADSGNIILNEANNLTGDIYLTAATGSISLTNNSATNIGSIDTTSLSITSQGTITQIGAITAGSATLSTQGSIDLKDVVDPNNTTSTITNQIDKLNNVTASGTIGIQSDNNLTIDGAVTANSDIDITSSGRIIMTDPSSVKSSSGNITLNVGTDAGADLGLLQASNGTVTINANDGQGYITDANGVTTNVIANNVVLNAGNGIGSSGDSIETQASNLTAVNGAVNSSSAIINISNKGDVYVSEITNDTGGINFTNEGDIDIGRISTSTSNTQASVSITANSGSITAHRPMPTSNPISAEEADIAAYSADIYAAGNFGTPDRPVIIYAKGNITLFSVISWDPVFLPSDAYPGRISNTSLLNFSAFETLTSLAGDQVVEVESLDDVDPAIFTNVHNYNMAEIAIRMPRDQLYEDELEKYGMK